MVVPANANYPGEPNQSFDKAIESLRQARNELERHGDLQNVEAARDAVYARFGRAFAPENLPALTAEEYLAFLRFENNQHWTGINRYGSRTVRDMDALRSALVTLTDESRPLAERYTAATGDMVVGLDRATATPILHVAYPEQYGVWNSKSEAGLKLLGLYPKLGGVSSGQQYAAINAVLLRLRDKLGISLWTLDTLWEVLNRRKPLAPPFNAIFADRAQAEWAFEFFAETVRLLGGGPDDKRFALTLPGNRDLMRLNMGNWAILSFANSGQQAQLTALVQPMEHHFSFPRSDYFRDTAEPYAIFSIPTEKLRLPTLELTTAYEQSMAGIAEIFRGWRRSNLRGSHVDKVWAALFDADARQRLLDEGVSKSELPDGDHNDTKSTSTIKPTVVQTSTIAHEFKGFSRDAFAFLEELRANNSKVWMDANRDRWQQSVFAPMRDLFADVGRAIKPLFDPYLEPDRLEVRPTVRNVLARINRNWSARISGPYYDYYWGAFYRERLSRQEDAQLHITLWPENLRFGFYIGEYIKDAAFKQRLQADPAPLYAVIRYLELDRDFAFERVYPDGRREGVAITAPDDLREWIATGDYNLLQRLTPDETAALGPALADRIYDALRRVFPVYLWAVNDDPVPLVERYLAAEFPDPDVTAIEPPPPSYTRADFLRETYLTEAEADDLLAMLEEKRQVIFTGPPGTGKTYVARRLAKLLIGLADPPPERLTIVQFHPAYGYEEFIEGIRPTTVDVDGRKTVDYPVRKGAFVRFCQEAARRPNERCVFIIDEINRGNVPRIFGELMLLLEYRDETVPLPYSGDPFRIPPNVYLIGTMNTADRSIALVDFALRRRFYFRRFAADPALLRRWLAAQSPALPYLERLYEQLVDHFRDDPDFAIGHSVFMQSGLTEAGLARIWRWSVLPYLREYHVEKLDEVRQWEWDHEHMRALRGAAGQGPGALPDSDAADEAGDTAEAWDDAAQNGAADGA